MTLAPDMGNDIAVLNLVRTDTMPESPHRLSEELAQGELLLNLRAEGDPERLKSIAMAGLETIGQEMALSLEVDHLEHFRPGRPQPTHRMVTA